MSDTILEQRLNLAQRVINDPRFGTASGYVFGARTAQTNLFGESETLCYVSKTRGGQPTSEALIKFDFAYLTKIHSTKNQISDAMLQADMAAQVGKSSPEVPLEAALLSLMPATFADLTAPTAMMALLHTANAETHLQTIFGDAVPIVRYTTSFVALIQACPQYIRAEVQAIAIPGFGILISGNTPDEAFATLDSITQQAEAYCADYWPDTSEKLEASPLIGTIIPEKRAQLSAQLGMPVICLTQFVSETTSQLTDSETIAITFADRNLTTFASDQVPSFVQVDEIPVWMIAGETVEAAYHKQDILRRYLQIKGIATQLGGYVPPSTQDITLPEAPTIRQQFTGEVVWITGAASGIGKATTDVFLERGAVVVGFDIDPAISTMWADQPNFLGVEGDVRIEADVLAGIDAAVQRFGGIDIVFLNAGINEDHADLAEFDLQLWDEVMQTNLNANAMILRSIYPVLKHAPKGGRVVFNASKSAPAPGPGSSSYTVSKMALVQLARLTTLEWSPDKIRVYVVNANGIFDTKIWKDNMAEKRAAHYGMTLDDYRRNNLLKVQIWSRDVGELVADLCGDHFAKTTGFQLPIDGGNARVL